MLTFKSRERSVAVFFVWAITVASSTARAEDVFSDVPEAAGDRLVYTLNIDNSDNYSSSNPAYLVNNSAAIASGSYTRVGYYMQLQPVGGGPTEYAYTSFDAAGFSYNADKLGVPTVGSAEFYNQSVTNMNVVSDVPGIVTGTSLGSGTVQFWPGNYAGDPNNSNVFDYADTNGSPNAGYGHMEIGNTAAGQSIITFSNWGGNGGDNNVGIGNQPTNNPDYTFANNASSYVIKELQVVVNNTPAALPDAPSAPGAVTSLDPTLAGYKMVYHESISGSSNINSSAATYTTDLSSAPNVQNFDRVAYVLELQNTTTHTEQWISVSFARNNFATDASKIGIPTVASGEVYNQGVDDMHIASNVAGIVTGDHHQHRHRAILAEQLRSRLDHGTVRL